MATLKPPRKISKRHELRQDKVVTFYAKAWDYFDKNRTVTYGLIAGIVIIGLSILGFSMLQTNKADEAQRLLGRIIKTYETGAFQSALDGKPDQPGLLVIADDYGSTEAGNLARFYAADALYQLGNYDGALRYYEAFDKSGDFISASAIAGEAAVYENKEEFLRAAGLYRRAALHYESDISSPQYLLSAGRAYELAGEYDEALEAYELIRERFPDSNLTSGVDFYIARVLARENT